MARPIWTGTLSFGLVAVPVGLYSATEDHSVHFRQLQRGTSDRVRNQRVNERTGEEVEYRDVVKGFELAEGEYVVLDPVELEQISPGRSKSIEISGFVDLAEVDPIYFDKTYYLGPRGKEYGKVYGLLHRALADTNRAGLATFVMRGKQYLAAVRVEGEVLVLQTMHYAEEVRDPHREIDNLPQAPAEPSEKELAAARQLIEMLSAQWKPEEYRDTYTEQVRELVEAKLAGEEVVSAAPAPETTNVVDLMAVLERSLQQAGGDGEGSANQARAAKPAAKPSAKPAAKPTAKPSAKSSAKSVERPQAEQPAEPAEPADLAELSKAELYRLATEQGVTGRSSMTRDQLLAALHGSQAEPAKKHRLRAVS
ncbi:DNA end-binding protein Ku [Kitasatospora sp. GAS204A]|uniref:non-homologous end joining protein Ku n=1 Tax=unclassified Kitasatospora TaxID=2633591 RepID=UPI0024769993|nr:Ku protein [Kitasatospora sp. GAS204B]MDH6121166.1 DNA end-binding protein Ku [Kitasatospora sp. GAS204B]